ncbi:MAG: hypothetical protein LIO93_05570 [Bacteroidales bacterium]|nr:hypothetical protein [Bacteroidales bacterium]
MAKWILYKYIVFFFLFQTEGLIFVSVMKKKRKHSRPAPSQPRNKRLTLMVSEEEFNRINSYLEKYKIGNRSHWMRTTLLSQIGTVLVDRDYPTLFSEHEMRK